MASVSADLAATVFGLAYRRSPNPLSRVQATLLFPHLWRPKNLHSRALSYSTSSRSRFVAVGFSKPKRSLRSFTVAATATTTSQSEGSDLTTKIPPDDRIPATIITGFLGSGKVHSLCALMHYNLLPMFAYRTHLDNMGKV